MTIFFRWTVVYVVVCAAFVIMVRDNPDEKLLQMVNAIPEQMTRFGSIATWVFIPMAAVVARQWNRGLRERLPEVLGAFVACTAITIIFPMAKATLPAVNPFWADPMLAQVDRALHFGVDPFRIVMADWIRIPISLADVIYVKLWLVPAIYFPFLLAFFDPNEDRRARFSMLYLFILFFLGLVMAGIFMSAGPIYYGYVTGDPRFSDVLFGLLDRGLSGTEISRIQVSLWDDYTTNGQNVGSGISAFPSVHIAMTALYALYLYELSKKLLAPAVLLVLIYLFLSVYLGWHYAVDGYVSILVVLAAYALAQFRTPKINAAAQLTPV